MPVRPEMQDLIDLFRERGQAGTTDSFNSITYWTDQQLQDILDANRFWGAVELKQADTLIYVPVVQASYYADPATISYYDIDEDTLAITATYATRTKEITLDAESDDLAFINAAWVSLNQALAELWEQKAAQRANYINFKAGANKMDMEQEYNHCGRMRDYYRAKRIKRWTHRLR